jgi:hypothetical protein
MSAMEVLAKKGPEVEIGNYFRSDTRAGAGIEYGNGTVEIYANGEIKYLMSGAESEIKSFF